MRFNLGSIRENVQRFSEDMNQSPVYINDTLNPAGDWSLRVKEQGWVREGPVSITVLNPQVRRLMNWTMWGTLLAAGGIVLIALGLVLAVGNDARLFPAALQAVGLVSGAGGGLLWAAAAYSRGGGLNTASISSSTAPWSTSGSSLKRRRNPAKTLFPTTNGQRPD